LTQKCTGHHRIGSITVWLSAFLILQLLLGIISRGTPSLHQALEHGVWGRLSGFHLHVPFFGAGHDDRLNPHLHGRTTSSDGSDNSEDESPAEDHEHHGLPDLLQAGLIDAVEPVIVMGNFSGAHEIASKTASSFLPVPRFEFIRAPRPPPVALL
jgi:hypothetical protein